MTLPKISDAIHPKVSVPAVVGSILTLATILAHVFANQTDVPWLVPAAAASVTALQFITGYITPGPEPQSVATISAVAYKVLALLQEAAGALKDNNQATVSTGVLPAEAAAQPARHAAAETTPAPAASQAQSWRPVAVGNPDPEPGPGP